LRTRRDIGGLKSVYRPSIKVSFWRSPVGKSWLACRIDARSFVLGTPKRLIGKDRAVVDERIKGPASYFPSIERKYGRPISEWQELVRKHYPSKHMELVSMLKSEYGMGHGHANAIVAQTLAEDRALSEERPPI
jgi:hypothetical protein